MSKENCIIKRGELVVLSTGEYSSYSITLVARVKKDMDFSICQPEIDQRCQLLNLQHWNRDYAAAQYLIDRGYIEELNVSEIDHTDGHLFDCGRLT